MSFSIAITRTPEGKERVFKSAADTGVQLQSTLDSQRAEDEPREEVVAFISFVNVSNDVLVALDALCELSSRFQIELTKMFVTVRNIAR